MKVIYIGFILNIIFKISLCWWDTGHMLVAKIAEITLLEEDKDAFILAQKITNILNPFSHEQITDFVESACWPDDVKTYGLLSMNDWHFIDLPVRKDKNFNEGKQNITYTPNDALGILHAAYEILTKWTFKEVENINTQYEKSMMARYFVHVLGDVHQPLHSSALYDSEKFPKGDEGGNLFLIKFKDGIGNLHKLYDSGIDRLNNNITRPLKKQDHEYLSTTAKQIMDEFHKDDLPELQNYQFSDWIQESHDISQNFIYKDIEYDGTPTEAYLEEAYNCIRRRLALGGYRLAEILKHVNRAYQNPKLNWPINEDHIKFLK